MDKIFDYEGSQQHYTLIGNGPAVLLIHGFGEDGRIWESIVPQLQTSYTLVIPHLPGSNKSELLKNTSIENMADVMFALLEVENLKSIVVLGHSMGGYIALAMAEKHPSLIDKLGLIHSTAFADTPAKIEARRKSIEFIQDRGAKEFLDATISNLFRKDSTNSQIDILKTRANEFTNTALIAYYQAMIARLDRSAILSKFEKPILFVAGQYDNAIPIEQSLQQAHLGRIMHFSLLQESGHMGMWEEQEKFLTVISSFLASKHLR